MRSWLVPVACLSAAFAACDDGGADPYGDWPDAAFVPFDAQVIVDARPQNVCSVVTQSCFRNDKCTFVAADAGLANACVPITGNLPVGSPCTSDAPGHDDCDRGGFCSVMGELSPAAGGTLTCHQLCSSDLLCGAGERCGELMDGQGICGATCTAFAGTCADGMTCADEWHATTGIFETFLTCRSVGDVAEGEPCADRFACGADHVCVDPSFGTNTRCHALCDASHACATGSCFYPGGVGAVGICT